MKKTNTHKIEADFSTAVQDAFDGWIKRVERARGMQDGFPDLVMLLPSGNQFCELKIGSVIDGVLWCEEVRPAQIKWHFELSQYGGQSFFLVGVFCGDRWRAYAFDGNIARFWETTGFAVGETCFEIDMNNLADSLAEFIYRELES